ncbi:MAG: hypothetical protein KBB94_08230 [Legionellaceae bacterium]|nr:hypothetical protein [Legionellaceae bacterium]MBP9775617.1 hypothetical protein [Legionellaceae bacterium]
MTKNTYIENFIIYQKSTDKSLKTLAIYRSDLVQFAVWFESIKNETMRLINITPTDDRRYKQHLIDSGLREPTLTIVEILFRMGMAHQENQISIPSAKNC